MSLPPRQTQPAYQLRPPRPSSSSLHFNDLNEAPVLTSLRSSWATSIATVDSEQSNIRQSSVGSTTKSKRKLSRLFGPFRSASTTSCAGPIESGTNRLNGTRTSREHSQQALQALDEIVDAGICDEGDCLQNEMAVMKVDPFLLRTDPRTQQPPLLRAIAAKDRDAIESLLAREPRLLHCRHGKQGLTPLIFAIITRDDNIFQLLVDRGANLKTIDLRSRRSPIEWAVINRHRHAVNLILEKDPALINTHDQDGLNLPSLAYENRGRDLAMTFIEWGVVSNCKTRDGVPLLIHSIQNGDQALANLLINMGAQSDCTDREGKSALILAIQKDEKIIAMNLINALALRGRPQSLDARDSNGATALMCALSRGQDDLAGFLVLKGARR